MKNFINLKPALLTTLVMMSLTGCIISDQHPNVVQDITDGSDNKNEKLILLRDIRTGKERVYRHTDAKDSILMNSLQKGDTVVIICSFGLYNNKKVLNPKYGIELHYDPKYKDSKDFKTLKQQFEKSR